MTTTEQAPAQSRPEAWSLLRSLNEPAIYGVVLVAGLVAIIADGTNASWQVLTKVLATLTVFWLAHVYAGVVAHLGDHHDDDVPARTRVTSALWHSLRHSWGMLLAGVIPVVVLALGVVNLLSDSQAMWGTLWAAVLVLGALGWLGVAVWSPQRSLRVAAAVSTSLLGVVLVALKVLVH